MTGETKAIYAQLLASQHGPARANRFNRPCPDARQDKGLGRAHVAATRGAIDASLATASPVAQFGASAVDASSRCDACSVLSLRTRQ